MSKKKSQKILDKVESMKVETPKTVSTNKTQIYTNLDADGNPKQGRPVEPTSVRQQRLAELEVRKQDPNYKPGRKADPNSESFKKKMAQDVRRKELEAKGIELKRGRPSDPDSESFKKRAIMEAKKEAGIELKRGRPSDPNSTAQQKLRDKLQRAEARKEAYKMLVKEGKTEIVAHLNAEGVNEEVFDKIEEQVAQ